MAEQPIYLSQPNPGARVAAKPCISECQRSSRMPLMRTTFSLHSPEMRPQVSFNNDNELFYSIDIIQIPLWLEETGIFSHLFINGHLIIHDHFNQ